MSEPPTPRPALRLLGLDQARAVAILAMLVAHFAPGVFVQLPQLDSLRAPVYGFARLATPTFVVVFGVTIGFVYLPRHLRRGPRRTAVHLGRRAAVMLVCAGVIGVPYWARLAAEGEADPWVWLAGLYSVLLFYVLALALLPVWLWWLCPSVGQVSNLSGQVGNLSYGRLTAKCLLGGVALWLAGTAGHRLIPEGPPGGAEYIRTILASGSYAYFQLMGTALLAVPGGVWLRARWEAGLDHRSLVGLLMVALGLAAVGGLWGLAVREYELGPFVAGELRTPPRAWYFLHVGGVGLALVPVCELATRALGPVRPLAYGLALFGQAGLVVYTGHVFVLPGLALADRFTPLHGAARVVVGLVPLAAFCAVVMYTRHRRAVTSSPASTRSPSARSLPSP